MRTRNEGTKFIIIPFLQVRFSILFTLLLSHIY